MRVGDGTHVKNPTETARSRKKPNRNSLGDSIQPKQSAYDCVLEYNTGWNTYAYNELDAEGVMADYLPKPSGGCVWKQKKSKCKATSFEFQCLAKDPSNCVKKQKKETCEQRDDCKWNNNKSGCKPMNQ